MVNNLAMRRAELGITQAELAALAGVSRQTVSDIESGAHSPSLETALMIAKALNRSVEELFSL